MEECSHKYVHLRTIRVADNSNYNIRFCLTDVFYCESCLKQVEKKKEEYCRETPDWFRNPE